MEVININVSYKEKKTHSHIVVYGEVFLNIFIRTPKYGSGHDTPF